MRVALRGHVFVSWHRHWKGVYIHSWRWRYTLRLYLWGADLRRHPDWWMKARELSP